MALPVFRRFSIADYPTAPSWLAGVFNPLNIFCETTVQNLNKNLVIGQNVQGMKYSTSFTTAGSFTPITFAYIGGGQPDCCLIGNISKADGTIILNPVSITSWNSNINVSPTQIRVDYIAGLDASSKYNITLLVV
jgi:hypothetical protein